MMKNKIIVTGAAGFIGSCVVARLNQEGYNQLILVDCLKNKEKEPNIAKKKYLKYYDKAEFISSIETNQFDKDVDCVIHMGACSSTTLQDAKYFEENNFLYTRKLAEWSLKNNVHFIYASSAATYGDGSVGYKDDVATIRRCKPLNLYGESKQKFDQWVLDHQLLDKVVGLKFFNVFGPNEYHKGDMQSVVAKSYEKVAKEGKMSLFKSYHSEYKDGEQKRDFVYIKDVVEVIMFFLNNRKVHGIYNVGTGKAQSWNDLAQALFKAVNKPFNVSYIEMPETLRPRYQYFTQADMSSLRQQGYTREFMSLEHAVKDYVSYLKKHAYW